MINTNGKKRIGCVCCVVYINERRDCVINSGGPHAARNHTAQRFGELHTSLSDQHCIN